MNKQYVENDRCVLCGADARSGRELLRLNDDQVLRRCGGCTLIANSRFRSDLENVYGDGYFETSAKGEAGGYFHYRDLEDALNADYRFAYERIARALDERGGGARILDVGCGYGFFLKQFLGRPGVDLWGLELSRKAASAAREAIPNVIEAPVEQVAFDRPFDFIVSFEVVEHVFEPKAFMSKLASALAPGGRLFLTTPNIGSAWFPLLRRRWPALHPDSHNHYFTPKTMRELARGSGLEVVRLDEKQLLHKTVHQLRKRMGELFPASPAVLNLLSSFDERTLPFLSGGSMEVELRRV
ncbi:MAG TPA: class I SAM-dependent methyltransferase [Polyangiaceae bacterium]|jgi:2-polyprenyl-3-methyl-5-hydroxy-6-metoxy-1,4-benzoquinol methylase|nr:class I SAM-dependent methyltransferase [Polyangiaceae bacterium]